MNKTLHIFLLFFKNIFKTDNEKYNEKTTKKTMRKPFSDITFDDEHKNSKKYGATFWLQGYKVTRLQGYKVTRLQGYNDDVMLKVMWK